MGRHSADIFKERDGNMNTEHNDNDGTPESGNKQSANHPETVDARAPGLGSTLATSAKRRFSSIVDGEEGSIFWGIKELIRLGGIGLHAVNTYLIESQRRLAEQQKGRDNE